MNGTNMDTSMGDMDMNMGGMWMWFHTTINDTVLFSWWTVNTIGGMIFSCLIVFVAAFNHEALKWSRLVIEHRLRMRSREQAQAGQPQPYRLLSPAHFIQTALFTLQFTWSYLLMLVFMTYSFWLCMAVVLGAGVGFFVFGGQWAARHYKSNTGSGAAGGGNQATAVAAFGTCCGE